MGLTWNRCETPAAGRRRKWRRWRAHGRSAYLEASSSAALARRSSRSCRCCANTCMGAAMAARCAWRFVATITRQELFAEARRDCATASAAAMVGRRDGKCPRGNVVHLERVRSRAVDERRCSYRRTSARRVRVSVSVLPQARAPVRSRARPRSGKSAACQSITARFAWCRICGSIGLPRWASANPARRSTTCILPSTPLGSPLFHQLGPFRLIVAYEARELLGVCPRDRLRD